MNRGTYQNGYGRRNDRHVPHPPQRNFAQNDQAQHAQCSNCGISGHQSSDDTCPAKGRTCGNCKKIGHYSRVCWKKKKFAPVHAINDMDMTNMMEAYKEIEQPMPSPGTQTPPAMIDDHDYKF